MRSHGPTQDVAPYSSARAALSSVSTIRLLLPEPLTPVIALISPIGTSSVTSFRLCARAPTTRSISSLGDQRSHRIDSRFSPER